MKTPTEKIKELENENLTDKEKLIRKEVLELLQEAVENFEEYKIGYNAGGEAREKEMNKLIDENRKEIDYVLCYGLKRNLTKEEIECFKKVFVSLYEDKLKSKLQEKEKK